MFSKSGGKKTGESVACSGRLAFHLTEGKKGKNETARAKSDPSEYAKTQNTLGKLVALVAIE